MKGAIYISQELEIGGNIVGSDEYFRYVNEKTFLGSIMNNKSSYNYYNELEKLASKISNTADEVFDDLRKYTEILHNISNDNRQNLIKFLMGLYDIMNMTRGMSGKIDDCISLLALNSFSTGKKSSASDREIEEGVNIVKNGWFLNSSDRMDIVKRAFEWGINDAVGDSREKAEYLEAVTLGRNREFLGDVWLKIWYDDNKNNFTGRCGRVICTKEYIDHLENHVFGRNISDFYMGFNGDKAYKEQIIQSFEQMVNMVENDLEYGVSNKYHILYENEEKLNKFTYNIEKTGIRCYNIDNLIEKLTTTKPKTDNPDSYGKNIHNMMQFFGVNNPEDIPKLADNEMVFMENIKSVAFGISGIAIVMDNDKYCTYTLAGLGLSHKKAIPYELGVTKGCVYNVNSLSDYEGAFLGASSTAPQTAKGGAVAFNSVYAKIISGGSQLVGSIGVSLTYYFAKTPYWVYGEANINWHIPVSL